MKQRVLVIDDDPDLLAVIRGLLEVDGFGVDIAPTGGEGLSKSTAAPPDLILLDLMMPGMNGIEVFKKLKANPKTASIPVIFLTAMQDKEFSKTALTLGADRYISKPCESEDLLSTIRETLGVTA